MQTRHSSIVVGPTGAGKSTVINIYKAVENAQCYYINPKAITTNELYGTMDIQTREWSDGLLSKVFRIANEKPTGKDELRWIIFDGDVDPEWAENLNSVLDDNKLLTLPNGERIQIPPHVKIMFEVETLKYATLATVSRCGMVWFSDDIVDYKMIFFHYLQRL